MHLLLAEQLKTPKSVGSTLVSVAMHGAVVVVLVTSGQIVAEKVRGLITESVQYLLPVDRAIGLARPAQMSEASSAGPRAAGTEWSVAAADGNGAGSVSSSARAGAAYTPWPANSPESEPALSDGTYSQVDVDSVAERDPASGAPEYPEALRLRNVEGTVRVRFEVDSTGLVDLSTARIMIATQPLFMRAVLDALPKMRFRPARIGDRPVRQLVEIPFDFRIVRKKVRTT